MNECHVLPMVLLIVLCLVMVADEIVQTRLFDGLRAADGHGHAGDKDNEEQPEFGHAPGIDKGDPSPAEALDPFGRDLAG